MNRTIPHISLHHVTPFELITAEHFDQRYNKNLYRVVHKKQSTKFRDIVTTSHTAFTDARSSKFAEAQAQIFAGTHYRYLVKRQYSKADVNTLQATALI